MGSRTSLQGSGIRRMLIIFAALAIAGVLMLAISVVVGLALLVIAEIFFAVAYRRFARQPKTPG
jgi:membrane protein implicated in regulation of membrane protease activity